MPVNRIKVGSFVAGGVSAAQAQALAEQAALDALASDTTVTDAAAIAATAAVDAEILGRPILEAGDILEADPVFAVVDENGARTWIEAAADGGLTDHAVDKIGEHISGAVEADMTPDGLSFAVVDDDDRRTWIEADDEGKPTARALTLIGDGLGDTFAETVYPADNWAHWGDSLTAGSGGTPFPTQLAALTGQDHYNGGWSGQVTSQIAGREGGVPARVTLTGDALPASGAVTVTDITYTPLSNSGSRLGSIAGVDGTLAQDGAGAITFTRTTAGDAVTVAPGAMFLPWHGEQYRDRIVTIWAGRNDFLYISHALIVSRIQAMIDYLSPSVRRVIVMEIPPDSAETTGTANRTTLDAANTALADAFAPYWLDIASWLRTSEAATAAGITFTATDTTDIANGVTPTSLRFDTLHLNTNGYQAVAYRVHQEAQTRGWIA